MTEQFFSVMREKKHNSYIVITIPGNLMRIWGGGGCLVVGVTAVVRDILVKVVH